jgi:membrane peptidoglycan carboxypeptidase
VRKKLFIFFIFIIGLVFVEMKTSYIQSYFFNKYSSKMSYNVKENGRIIYPSFGPYNNRLGYTKISNITNKLNWKTNRANWNDSLYNFVKSGYNPPFNEKITTGINIVDKNNLPIISSVRPKRTYETLKDVPDFIVKALSFVENKEILKNGKYKNPAIDWYRLLLNSKNYLLSKVFNKKVSGGSTIATQMEKFKFSPNGRTEDINGKKSSKEKFRQIVSASIRTYRNGRNTENTRKNIIVNFINSVPLGAIPDYGEVIGFGDALWYWFGTSFEDANNGIKNYEPKYIKEILSLIISQRRPNYYLLKNRDALEKLTNVYLNLLYKENIISYDVYYNSLNYKLTFNPRKEINNKLDKGNLSVKRNLMGLLGENEVYKINTFDMVANSTTDIDFQNKTSKLINDIQENPTKYKMFGSHLLSGNNDIKKMMISFSLYEIVENSNYLRIQVDTSDGEFNLNDGMKLELGSTAKLRTLITYLYVVSKIYEEKEIHNDSLSIWVKKQGDIGLDELLKRAMGKEYSGSAGEGFFTGGGIHYFSNFEGKHGGSYPVIFGLQKSINLMFIRIMRDIVDYYKERNVELSREQYINRYINLEADTFINKFKKKHFGLTKKQSFVLLSEKKSGVKLATLFRVMFPEKSFEEFFNETKCSQELYDKYNLNTFNWQDLGYITKINPLELYVVSGYKDKERVIRESYKWIWSDKKQRIQNLGISIIKEIDAFKEIHKHWKKFDYPFNRLIPSLATSIGSSGDNPTALAKLIGVVLRGGKLCKDRRFTKLAFGKDTPYFTELTPYDDCKEVLNKSIADVVKNALKSVVEKGTAIRVKDKFKYAVGGKTGTGDNRIKKTNYVLNRTGTFAFYIGDKWFGAITIFVDGKSASEFHFTSSLPLRVLEILSKEINLKI